MKTRKLLSLIILSFLIASCSQESSIQKELVEIKQLLIEINQKLGDSKTNSEKQNDSLAESYQTNLSFRGQGPNIEELDKISLPDNPSEKQIKEYIRKIGLASAKQRSYSGSDPQVFMLAQIGNENLELLIKSNFDRHNDFYAIPAITKLAEEKDKELILKYLPFKKNLVKVVTKKGWEEDAKKTLYNELREIPHYLPTEWIQAIANLQEPCIYDDLKQYLILGSNKSWTYNTIKMLPGIELEDAVKKAWKNAKLDEWSRSTFAPIALSYGQVDALPVIIESLNSSPSDHNAVRYPRKYILQYTYATGTNNDIRNWYNENKDNLIFDKKQSKYVVNK